MTKDAETLAFELSRIAHSITPIGASAAETENGGYVQSLTEAVLDVSASLLAISKSIGYLADAIQDHSNRNDA